MAGPEGAEGITAQDLGDFIGAGVLPYTVTGGRVKFFLGKELCKGRTLSGKDKYCWSDFGGKKEDGLETAAATASREFSEETLGVWGGMGYVWRMLACPCMCVVVAR